MVSRHRYRRKQHGGVNPVCKTLHKRPFRCNTTQGCVYCSKQRQCKSQPRTKGTAAEQRQRLTQSRIRDKEKYPEFYKKAAARSIQRTRRHYIARRPAQPIELTLLTMDGKPSTCLVPRRSTFRALKADLATATGVMSQDLVLMHGSSENPVSSMKTVKELADPETNAITLYAIVQQRNRQELFQEMANAAAMLQAGAQPMEVITTTDETGHHATELSLIGNFDVREGEGLTSFRRTYPMTWACCIPKGETTTHCSAVGQNQFEWAAEVRGIEVPDAIASAPELETLIIVRASVVSLPPALGTLVNLTRLSLTTTLLRGLPPSIGGLQSLRHLSVVNSCLTNAGIPESLGKLINLETLELVNSRSLFVTGTAEDPMATLPEGSGIRRFIRAEEVESAPTIIPIISSLTNLTTLNLSCIYLNSLPFPQLTKLQHLILDDCFLTAVPDWVSGLQDLVVLSLEGDRVQSINYPEGSYPALRELRVEWRHLRGYAHNNAEAIRAAIETRASES